MKSLNSLLKIVAAFGTIMFLSVGIAQIAELPFKPVVLTITGLVLLGSFAPQIKGALGFNLLTQIFADEITKGLFPDNEFYKNSKDDSAWINANQVNLPQKGAAPSVTVDRAVFPATASQRTDTASGYVLHEFSTDPIHIQYSEELVVNYDKRQSVLEDHILTLNTAIADYIGIQWGPALAANQVLTTGAARAALSPSATGTRLAITKADLIEVSRLLDRQNVPKAGRKALIPTDMYQDILNNTEFTDAQKFGTPGLPSGVITKILDFDIYVRSRGPVYAKTNTTPVVKRAYAAAGAAVDCEAAIFWHPMFVRRAEGGVQVFERTQDPLFYGDVFSAAARLGGVTAYTAETGVIALIEAWAS